MPTIVDIVQRARCAAVATDSQNGLLSYNDAALRLVGGRLEKAIGSGFFDFVKAEDSFGNQLLDRSVSFEQMMAQGHAVHGFELTAEVQGGRIRLAISVVLVVGTGERDALPDGNGEYAHIYLMRPVLRRRRADEAIERLLTLPADTPWRLKRERSEENQLTKRQQDVLQLLGAGLNNDEIAESLKVSVNTVRTHVQAIFKRLDTHTKAEAVARAFQKGLI